MYIVHLLSTSKSHVSSCKLLFLTPRTVVLFVYSKNVAQCTFKPCQHIIKCNCDAVSTICKDSSLFPKLSCESRCDAFMWSGIIHTHSFKANITSLPGGENNSCIRLSLLCLSFMNTCPNCYFITVF